MEMKAEYGTPRRTAIEELEFETDMKTDPARRYGGHGHQPRLDQARAAVDLSRQRRGGKGRAGMATKEEDFVRRCTW